MDENKDLEKQEPAGEPEGYISQDAPAPAEPSAPAGFEPAPEGPAPAKKANGGVIALVAVAAVLVIGIIAVLAFGGMGKKPEEAVQEAFSLTGEKLSALSTQLMEEIPFYKGLYGANEDGRSGTFSFAVDSIESPLMGTEAGLINNVAKMFSITGETVQNPSQQFVALTGQLNMAGSPLVDLFFEMSPDQLAFNVPKFSETVLSINPQTIADDVKNSPLYSPGMDEESLQELQEAFAAQFSAMSGMSGINAQKLQKEMYAILDGVFTNAVYEKPQKAEGAKLYTVKLDGEEVKNTLVSLLKYIYFESDISKMYSPQMREMLQSEIVAPVEQDCPPLPMTLSVYVAKSGLISQVDFVLDLDNMPGNEGSAVLTGVSGSYALSEDVSKQDMSLLIEGTEEDMPFGLDMTVNASYAGGTSSGLISMKMEADEMAADMGMEMAFDKEGKSEMSMNVDVSGMMTMDCELKGTYTLADNVVKYDYPTLKVGFSVTDEGVDTGYNAVTFKLNGESRPLEQPAQPAAGTVPLFSMTEEELMQEMQKYSDGMQNLVVQLFGAVMSSSMESGSPAA